MGKKVAVIGGGNMGGALVEGFLRSGKLTTENIVVATPGEDSQERFRNMGLQVYSSNREAVREADIVIVAVKPWLVTQVADEINTYLKNNVIIVSVAAGLDLEFLRNYFGGSSICFRVIPNTAAAYGASMTFIACEDRCDIYAPVVLELFNLVGEAALIQEKMMDAGMISGSCGTAYALRYIRAAMEASIQMGLKAGLSRTVVAQTLKGAAELMLNGDLHPEQAIDQVTTPGGITIVGLNAMEHKGFTSAVIEGHLAAFRHVKGE